MTRSLLTRILMVVTIAIVGLAITFALDARSASALLPLPEEDSVLLGQSGALFYAYDPIHSTLLLSEDARAWRTVPAPEGAALRAVAAPDAASDTLLVATDGALYRSADGGMTWARSAVADIARIVVPAATTGTSDAYLITRQGALLRTAGPVITPIAGLDAPVRDLAAGPRGQRLFVATDTGIARSTDSGATWAAVEGIPATRQIVQDRYDPSILYAATRNEGLYRTLDGGESWETANLGMGLEVGTRLAITAIAQDPASPGTLYVATSYTLSERGSTPSPAAILVSPDHGTQWIPLAPLEAGSPTVLAILPEAAPGAGLRVVTTGGTRAIRPDADRAMAQLASSDPAARLAGAKVLSVAAVPTQADALLPLLASEQDGQIAYYVARALGHIGNREVTDALTGLLAGDVPTITKLRVLQALEGAADPTTVPALAAAFQEEALARGAADGLAAIGTERAWQPLLATLADERLSPQRQAAMAAFEHSPEASVWLIPELSNDNPLMRAHSAQVLAWMGQAEARNPLRALLEDPDERVRANAAFALGELGDREVTDRLQRLAESDPSETVRQSAAAAIVRAEQPGAGSVATRRWNNTPVSWIARLRTESAPWIKVGVLLLTALLSLGVLAARPRSRSAQVL